MILTGSEWERLVQGTEKSPHSLLGMHRLGSRKGVVVRALIPGAAKVETVPVHDRAQPSIPLKRLGQSDLFEGKSHATSEVFAYDLKATLGDGQVLQGRDPYSFLPSLGETDLYLFNEGNDRRLHEKLGARLRGFDGVEGTAFTVWAPNARRVSVVGDFNGWDGRRHPMRLLATSGVWEIFIPGVRQGALYKFEVLDAHGHLRLKTDPFGFLFEQAPKNSAVVWDVPPWGGGDNAWLERRARTNLLRSPVSILEMHAGSWRKKGPHESFSYRELAAPLIDYTRRMGFTHIEFLPLAEHAFYPSWGYQVTGFYAPTSRYGTPDDLRHLIGELHQAGIGVLVDWVPAHFPRDDWSLARFDGTAIYEHEDPRQGAHQDWGTLIFNYGRHEVSNFLLANALFWIDRFHVDGLRVDAVASMLYLDYSRQSGEWVPNEFGGRENLQAIEFLKKFNHWVDTEHPGVLTVAEESTAWPSVTRPPYLGGLGFSLKWNMGWMHDTLGYFKRDPVHRKYHQNDLTFAMLYHQHENFVLPLSHDEVVHGKGSLLRRMPGDDWRRFANLRVLLGYQMLFPGKKLLFMGGEIGQSSEWNENAEISWELLDAGPYHAGLQRFVADLNHFYQGEPALWSADFEVDGFHWVDCSDHEQSVLGFLRRSLDGQRAVLGVLNLTPEIRCHYRLGLPQAGFWREALNSDAACYGGANNGNSGGCPTEPIASHGHAQSALLTLPPLAIIVLTAPTPAIAP